jgi:hypothetical protein
MLSNPVAHNKIFASKFELGKNIRNEFVLRKQIHFWLANDDSVFGGNETYLVPITGSSEMCGSERMYWTKYMMEEEPKWRRNLNRIRHCLIRDIVMRYNNRQDGWEHVAPVPPLSTYQYHNIAQFLEEFLARKEPLLVVSDDVIN